MIRSFFITEAGGHLVNEDAFVVEQHPDDAACWLCVLADGQGGRAGGGRASLLACQTAMGSARKETSDRLMDFRVWESIFRLSDQVVCADADAGFTTLIGFCLRDTNICGGSNGDSAVAVFDRTRKCVELTRNQLKNPPVGSGAAAFVPFAIDFKAPGIVLAMSDGVWKYSRWDGIQQAANHLRGQELVDDLLLRARLPQTGQLQDDFTLVLLQTDDSPT